MRSDEIFSEFWSVVPNAVVSTLRGSSATNPSLSAARHTMTTTMGPPPPKNPSSSAEPSTSGSTNSSAMAPPLPREPERAAAPSECGQEEVELNSPSSDATENPPQVSDSSADSSSDDSADSQKKREQSNNNLAVPYKIPPWSAAPGHEFFLEVLKDGSIINRCDVLVFILTVSIVFFLAFIEENEQFLIWKCFTFVLRRGDQISFYIFIYLVSYCLT